MFLLCDRSRTGGTPRGDSPNWVAPGALAGSFHPVNMPQPLAAPIPVVMPAPGAKPTAKPSEGDRAYPAATPQPVGSPTPTPQGQPTNGNFSAPQAAGGPAILKFPSAAPVTTNVTPTPDALQPVARPTTPPGTGILTTKPSSEDLNDDIKDLGLKLAGLTLLIKGLEKPVQTIANNTSPPAIEAAVCRPTQPGGCTSNLVNNVVGKGNEDLKNFIKNNGLDAAAQAEQLRLLNQLDRKLGAQMPGGVTGAFGRLSKFLGIDRIFNLINFMANLHNAFMLSNSLKFTLLEMLLSSVGNATGLWQSSEGENVDLNEVYNKGIRELFNSVLGDEQAARLEIHFKRANRIYQAAANSLNAVSSMMSSLGNVVEVGTEYSGKIGNALKAAGAVHEKAYQWMAEKLDAKTSPFIRFSRTTAGVTTALETINEISESVVEGQQAATEFQKANTEFINAVADAKKDKGIENKAVAAEVAKQKENALKDPTGADETGLFSFLTDL